MSEYTSHFVTEMDESMIQRCIYCGELISDYRGSMTPEGQGTIRGFDGKIFVSKGGSWTNITTIEPKSGFKDCREN